MHVNDPNADSVFIYYCAYCLHVYVLILSSDMVHYLQEYIDSNDKRLVDVRTKRKWSFTVFL